MEETVGKYWHAFITQAAQRQHPEHAVYLDDIKAPLGLWFRALGGGRAIRLDAASLRVLGQERTLLQKVAGTNKALALAALDDDCLQLPARIAVFADKSLNRELYFWLAALAANSHAVLRAQEWLAGNIQNVRRTLLRYPGLQTRYYRLAASCWTEVVKSNSELHPESEDAQFLRQAIISPLQEISLPQHFSSVYWLPMWLYPCLETLAPARELKDENDDAEPDTEQEAGKQKKIETEEGRRGEFKTMSEGNDGLLATRLESLFSWTEYVAVDRPEDEGEEEDAANTLNDLELITLSRNNKATSSRLKFDLDLPAEDADQVRLGEGVLQAEWDYRKKVMQEDYCCIQAMTSSTARPCELPQRLQNKARRIRAQFEKLLLGRSWENAQVDGSELDLDACLQLTSDRINGRCQSTDKLYRYQNRSPRDLACLLLADISFSTDAYVDDDNRIIDCIQDSLYLFAEALSLSGDNFAIQGFSSKRRSHVRISEVKHFNEAYNASVRGRIADLRPGYYTRMGAAIRYATTQLSAQPQQHKLLLLLTDGKPNDLDRYEGRYGIEDTRMAIGEANRQGVQPFCISIDDKASSYLPYIFGKSSYVFVRKVSALPARLPKLYLKLTSG